ncbi:hypothetical protein GT037_010351 [Alternaria burnsii]|uniref:SprT-like domain-containing protein n=1 Tax=Alternaria burnsii TaxID=1187904 RepID=A0A8H7ATY9_9PLEO|nr:uncharacterized protein GT037_010351 [Alternaria burnsii]KAF7671539.1 hypothetical protein GT037_010351 [Alternaria burnsii]CAI9629441.1 unnamed protein product [Alternaria burnsii]
MSVDQNGVTSLNDFSTPTLSGTTDPTAVAPGRLPSIGSLMTDLKRDLFYKKSLNHLFCSPCICDSNKCSQDCYFNYPYSCAAIDHRRDQIPILPNEKPEIIADSVYRPYEALHLVDSATKFFGRPYNEMNSEQQLALKYMCENREYLLEKLGSPDARVTFPVDRMRTLCTQLLSVFFLGAEIKIEFFWDFDVCEAMGWLGYTQTILRDDLVFERITMHPTQQTEVALRSLNRTESLALQRLSTLIHELIHAVLKSLCCRMCKTSNVNLADHGRAFQRLAMAIEERCPQLLGLTLDLGRINSIFADMTNQATGLNHPSMHDLEVYGFV